MAGVTIALRWTMTVTDTDADSEEAAPVFVLDKSITGATSYRKTRFSIQNATRTVWDAAGTGEEIGSFQFLALWSDVSVDVELTTGEGEGAEELHTFRLAANVPYCLGADDSYRNHSASDAYAGSLDVIDKIRVKEPSDVAATVHMFLVE
jgi:hypothetical protein